MASQLPSIEQAEDILSDSLAFLGGGPVIDSDIVQYGKLKLSIAPKEGKANTLLADHLFSPSLLLAERIENGLISLQGRTVIELGAGCALPSLLAASMPKAPSLVTVTDYPDDTILKNLERNIELNRSLYNYGCHVACVGYAWGADTRQLIDILGQSDRKYDIVIMSDLLHFSSSHDVLVSSAQSLLDHTANARLYVAAGKYTASEICDNFIRRAADAGLSLSEETVDSGWTGLLKVSGLDKDQLGVRKAMCRWWTGRWEAYDGAAPRLV